MKKWMMILTVALGCCILSCKKDGNGSSFCVNTIKNSPAKTALSNSEMNTVKYLFDHNQLDYTKYLFTQLQEDESGYHHVRCRQFANNLIIFTGDAIFHFDENDNYYSLSGNLITTINLNTKSSMKYDDVVKKYVELVTVDETFDALTLEDIIHGCFDVEFGYYDLHAGISDTNENFTKAWKIKPTSNDYPYAYINDENAETIYYDNGIRYENTGI